METLRKIIARALARSATYLTLWVAPAPWVPEPQTWAVRLDEDADTTVWVLFKRSALKAAEWHILCLIDPGAGPLYLIGDSTRCLAVPLRPDTPVECIAYQKGVDYAIRVRMTTDKRMRNPEELLSASCVDTAKRVLGLDEAYIYTPRQLLALLWRMR